jgi:hypothetical protein
MNCAPAWGIAAAAADVNVTYIDVQGIIDRVALDYQALGFKTASTYFLAPAARRRRSRRPEQLRVLG